MREGERWRCLYSGGGHCFNNSVGSDVKAGRGFCGERPAYRDGGLYFLDTLGGGSYIVRVDEESGLYLCRSAADAPEIDGNICVASEAPLYPGEFYRVKIDESDMYDLFGYVVEENEDESAQ